MEQISSLQNPKIKNAVKLQKAAERKEQQLFIVEGLKEIFFALDAAFNMHTLFVCPRFANDQSIDSIQQKTGKQCNVFEVTAEVFSKMAYRETSDGFLAIFHQKPLLLENIKLRKNPLILILESVEKPGNLGAILRTADAAQVDAVIVADPKTDFYNPNVIRSSVGCFFSTQVASASNQEVLNWLKTNNIHSYAAALRPESKSYIDFDFNKPTAFVMGTEADGLTDFWMQQSDYKIIIPMLGVNDSLNVSIAAAVLAFETMRQRNFIV